MDLDRTLIVHNKGTLNLRGEGNIFSNENLQLASKSFNENQLNYLDEFLYGEDKVKHDILVLHFINQALETSNPPYDLSTIDYNGQPLNFYPLLSHIIASPFSLLALYPEEIDEKTFKVFINKLFRQTTTFFGLSSDMTSIIEKYIEHNLEGIELSKVFNDNYELYVRSIYLKYIDFYKEYGSTIKEFSKDSKESIYAPDES